MSSNKKVLSSQKKLEYWVIGTMLGAVLIAMMFSDWLQDFIVSLTFILGFAFLPSAFELANRYLYIPWLDSQNEKKPFNNEEDDQPRQQQPKREYFPIWLRVSLWFFVGLVLAYGWSYFVPYILTLPFSFGRIAKATGWGIFSSYDEVWQYGWLFVFMVQYIVTLIIDHIRREEYGVKIWARFKYKVEKEDN